MKRLLNGLAAVAMATASIAALLSGFSFPVFLAGAAGASLAGHEAIMERTAE